VTAPDAPATARGRPAGPGLREPWLLTAAALVLLAATWIRTPHPALAAGLLAGFGLLAHLTRAARAAAFRRRIAFVVLGVVLVVTAGRYHAELRSLDRREDAVREQMARHATVALATAIVEEAESLEVIAAAALNVPTADDAGFAALASLVPPGGPRAVLRARAGRPIAWSGRLLIALDSLPAPVGIVATPFYLVAYAAEQRGAELAVATSVIHAEPPADALADALATRLAASTGVLGFAFADAELAAALPGASIVRLAGTPLLAVRAVAPSGSILKMRAWERTLPRAGAALALLVLVLLTVAWRRETGLRPRFFALAVALALPAVLPLSVFSNLSTWFDPSFFLVRSGWRFTANAGALALTAALLLLALLSVRRARPRIGTRLQAAVAVALVAGIGPFLLRELAGGVQVPSIGMPLSLWVSWQVTIFLAAVTVLLLGVTAGQGVLGRDRGLPVWSAPALAVAATMAAPVLIDAPGRFPPAYTVLWVMVIVALAFTRRARKMVLPVALVAACGATTLVWFSAVRERVDLAVLDVQGLSRADGDAAVLLDRFADVLDPARAARTRVEVLSQFARSELAVAEFPTEITTWGTDGTLLADLSVGRAPGVTSGVNLFAYEVQRTRQPTITEVRGDPGIHLVLSVPHADGTATTVVVAPRSGLVAPDPFGAFLGFSPPPAPEPPYLLRLGDYSSSPPSAPTSRGIWTRLGSDLHGDWQLASSGGLSRRLHAVVELRSFDALLTRGVLLVLLDLTVLGAVWFLMVAADGALWRWWRRRRREVLTSYRTRISAALFLCFLVPSLLFALWSFRRLQADDQQARDLLVRETLRGVAASDSVQLSEAAARFETPLFLYANGLLVATSDPLLDALAPVGRLLPPSVVRTLSEGDEVTTGRAEEVGPANVRLGYRAATDAQGVQYVLAAPARLDDRLLDRRRNDLAMTLLFTLALGALAALWVSGAAARQLSRPIRALRESALALARGDRSFTLRDDPPLEFTPVFSAFRRMTTDLAESREALETAERRLAATLRSVASGVLAVDESDRVTFSNPRAQAILGVPVTAGALLPDAARALIGSTIDGFRLGPDDEGATEFEHDGRRLSVRLSRLAPGSRRTVVTLDDVTDVTRAERILAWGEMARQVAHEIKNPLTPMRLGMQHLRRARHDPRVDFDRVLDENTARMLTEIDRLDEIARAFSRYGAPPLDEAPAERVDVAAIARDVLELEQMGQAEVAWEADIPDAPVWAAARDRELRDVLLNLLENARLAGARNVRFELRALPGGGAELSVRDDGGGIPPQLLTRIFEPHFSTRTSGSGLGLAISRRLIASWGGEIHAENALDAGAVLTVRLAPAPDA
jgi:two-component system, NtrC family, nitrogen regulation sensor histidine kinase NtrY